MIGGLREKGAKNVVLKGIDHGDGKIHNYIEGESVPLTMTTNELLPYMLHGTGDLFTSSLLAAVMAGKDLVQATRFASDFVVESMKVTSHQPDFEARGVSFEPLLGSIASMLE